MYMGIKTSTNTDSRFLCPQEFCLIGVPLLIVDTWVQVAVTYDQPNGVIKTFKDGEERTDLRSSYSGLLDDEWDSVYLGALAGDSRELVAGLLCTMYFDTALSQEQMSAAFSMCFPNGRQRLV